MNIQIKRVPLLLLSGGLDSTYLLQELLKRHQEVDVVTVQLESQAGVTGQQDQACRRILETVEAMRVEGLVIGRVRNVDNYRLPLWSHGRMRVPMSLSWLLTGISMLRMDTEDVYLGYLETDNSSRTANEFIQAWDVALKVADVRPLAGVDLPRLKLPLLKTRKPEIILKLHPKLAKHVVWCDSGTVGYDCGICWSCVSMAESVRILSTSKPKEYERLSFKARLDTLRERSQSLGPNAYEESKKQILRRVPQNNEYLASTHVRSVI